MLGGGPAYRRVLVERGRIVLGTARVLTERPRFEVMDLENDIVLEAIESSCYCMVAWLYAIQVLVVWRSVQ